MQSSIENIDPAVMAELLARRKARIEKEKESNSKCNTPENNQENPTQSVRETPRPLSENNLEQIDENLPLTAEGWQTLDFQSPAELLCFFNPQLNSGEITLHK